MTPTPPGTAERALEPLSAAEREELRRLAIRAESWRVNGWTDGGTSTDWSSFHDSASPDRLLRLLEERDRLAEALQGLLRFTHVAMSSKPDGVLDFGDLRAAENVVAALSQDQEGAEEPRYAESPEPLLVKHPVTGWAVEATATDDIEEVRRRDDEEG